MSKAMLTEAIHADGKRKMAIDERKNAEQELKELQAQLKRADPGEDGSQARPELLQAVPQLKDRIKKLERSLTMDDDLIAKGPEKDRLNRRREELEEIIKKDLPSEKQHMMTVRVSGDRDFNRAVDQTVAHQKRCGVMIQEWQEIMRRLEPENPMAADTRKLWD